MKKHVWILVAAAVVLLAAWAKPIVEKINFEKPVTKNISFAVYKANNYTSKVYDNASAKLQVAIVKIRGGKRSIVWQKEYDAKLLKEYPSLENALAQKVVVNDVVDSKERLEVMYIITYDAEGSKMQLQDGAVIDKGAKDGKLFINI